MDRYRKIFSRVLSLPTPFQTMLVQHCTEAEIKGKLILALDTDDPGHALEMVERYGDRIPTFKIGLQLFTRSGPELVKEVQNRGKQVFLDLKFHDIPHTVAGAVTEAARIGVFMLNVHTLGGLAMMETAQAALVKTCLQENLERPRLIGVTILTSMDETALRDEIGIPQRVASQVDVLARLAARARLDGVVASPREIDRIKKRCGDHFTVVTPGIRPPWASTDDQKRTMTPRQAIMEGADYLVVGRAVTAQKNPDDALNRLIEDSVF